MRVFVTGASGWVGSVVVKELLTAGHKVLGLVRSDQGAKQLTEAGADVLRGDVNDPAILRSGASACDGVIHLAFNHDFSQYKANCESDRKVIETLGDSLVGTSKPLIITSGAALVRGGRAATEDDGLGAGSDVIPRAASEEAAAVVASKGVNVYTVRLSPTVHGAGDHGFVSMLVGIARQKGKSAYVGEGENRWPAVHRADAGRLYRLILEKRPARKVFHAVAENGVPFRKIAEAIGAGLGLPVVSVAGEGVAAHFTWFTNFAALDCVVSSERTQAEVGWKPEGVGLLEDIRANYLSG